MGVREAGHFTVSRNITLNSNSSITGNLSLYSGNGGTGALYCAGTVACTMTAVDSELIM